MSTHSNHSIYYKSRKLYPDCVIVIVATIGSAPGLSIKPDSSSFFPHQFVRHCRQSAQHLTHYLPPVLLILGLPLKDIGYHLGDQCSVCVSIENTDVQQFWNIEDTMFIDYIRISFRRYEVILQEECGKASMISLGYCQR